MKLAALTLLIVATSGGAFAQSIPNAQEVTRDVVKAASAYADAISCGRTKIDAKSIAALVPYKSMESRDDAKYAVIWSGDIGCAGGSGTTNSAISIVRIGSGDNFLVDPLQSSPAIKYEMPVRYVERVVGNTTESLILEGKEFGPNDANCCPSVNIRATLKIDASGNWKLVDKKMIPTKK